MIYEEAILPFEAGEPTGEALAFTGNCASPRYVPQLSDDEKALQIRLSLT